MSMHYSSPPYVKEQYYITPRRQKFYEKGCMSMIYRLVSSAYCALFRGVDILILAR